MKAKNQKPLRPEQLDAKMDLLDLAPGNNDAAQRLPLIAGVEYQAPRTLAEIIAQDFGPTDPRPAA